MKNKIIANFWNDMPVDQLKDVIYYLSGVLEVKAESENKHYKGVKLETVYR